MDSTTLYSCSYCRKVFNYKPALSSHKKNQHLIEIKANILKKKSVLSSYDVVPSPVLFFDDDRAQDHLHQIEVIKDANYFDNISPFEPLALTPDDQKYPTETCVPDDPILNPDPEPYQMNENMSQFIPKVEVREAVEVIYLDSDSDEPVKMEIPVDCPQYSFNHNEMYSSSSQDQSSMAEPIYPYCGDTSISTVRDIGPETPCQNSVQPVNQSPIEEFLWCPVCLLPYTQLSTLKRHMQISHRIPIHDLSTNRIKPKRKRVSSGKRNKLPHQKNQIMRKKSNSSVPSQLCHTFNNYTNGGTNNYYYHKDMGSVQLSSHQYQNDYV